MSKYAVLKFSPFEYRYQQEYGVMPDYDFSNMVRNGFTMEEASRIRQERVEKLWAEMLAEHEREQRIKPFQVITKADRCPF